MVSTSFSVALRCIEASSTISASFATVLSPHSAVARTSRYEPWLTVPAKTREPTSFGTPRASPVRLLSSTTERRLTTSP